MGRACLGTGPVPWAPPCGGDSHSVSSAHKKHGHLGRAGAETRFSIQKSLPVSGQNSSRSQTGDLQVKHRPDWLLLQNAAEPGAGWRGNTEGGCARVTGQSSCAVLIRSPPLPHVPVLSQDRSEHYCQLRGESGKDPQRRPPRCPELRCACPSPTTCPKVRGQRKAAVGGL